MQLRVSRLSSPSPDDLPFEIVERKGHGHPDTLCDSLAESASIGLSAESGDDGQVGRGNRINGPITPYRPMSLEAAAGKNPVTHTGKLYNLLGDRMAHALLREIPGVTEARDARQRLDLLIVPDAQIAGRDPSLRRYRCCLNDH